MSKAVLMSIQPKWVEKIASGEKTIEVRKTKPKLETPFKVYIYETYDKKYANTGVYWFATRHTFNHGCGKVIGDFVCDRIAGEGETIRGNACLTVEELQDYCNGEDLYFWRISDLKIYDKPKELSEFYARCNIPESKCKFCDNCYDREDYYGRHYAVKKITRPPQSWFYVED